MPDPTPQEAAARIVEIRADLNDPARVSPFDQVKRQALVEETIRLTPFTTPPMPASTPSGPTFAERRAAQRAGVEVVREMMRLPQGHSDNAFLVEEAIALSKISQAPGAISPTTNLSFDLVQAPSAPAEPEPPIEVGKVGQLANGVQWDVAALEEGEAAAEAGGIGDGFEAL